MLLGFLLVDCVQCGDIPFVGAFISFHDPLKQSLLQKLPAPESFYGLRRGMGTGKFICQRGSITRFLRVEELED